MLSKLSLVYQTNVQCDYPIGDFYCGVQAECGREPIFELTILAQSNLLLIEGFCEVNHFIDHILSLVRSRYVALMYKGGTVMWTRLTPELESARRHVWTWKTYLE